MSNNRLTEVYPITIVQGAQWGSEAKGSVTAALAIQRDFDVCVRTGTVNAGHTVIYNGQPFKMQQLPVAWVNPRTRLYLGPGAYIHPEILARELRQIQSATGHDVRPRLYVDYRCGLHLPQHTVKAQAANRHHKMGATGKGCSEAVVSKIRDRGTPEGQLFKTWLERARGSAQFEDEELLYGLNFVDTVAELNACWDQGATILIEGTQGTLLDLHTGPYPYTTHKQTLPANWLAEAGLSPSLPVEVILVARTFPIRVAGNSGPMPGEIGWPTLAREINAKLAVHDLPPRVPECALQEFEVACMEVTAAYFTAVHPEIYSSIPLSQLAQIENWDAEVRDANRAFVSELHAKALAKLSPECVNELSALFELTTVTKKLRRLARLDLDTLKYSCMLNRPRSLALTFINYEFPEVWGQDWTTMSNRSAADISDYCQSLGRELGYPISYVSTGPETELVLPRHVAGDKYLGQWPVKRGKSRMTTMTEAAHGGDR